MGFGSHPRGVEPPSTRQLEFQFAWDKGGILWPVQSPHHITAVIYTTDARNSADLEFSLTGGSLWQQHCPKDQPAPPGGLGIDPRIGAAALRTPAASWEDSRPHAILKLQPRNSFDYRVSYEPQLKFLVMSFVKTRFRAAFNCPLLGGSKGEKRLGVCKWFFLFFYIFSELL